MHQHSKMITAELRKVRESLEDRKSTLDSLFSFETRTSTTLSEPHLPFYIQVETKQILRQDKDAGKTKKLIKARTAESKIRKFAGHFTGTPFNVQSARFKTNGLHPNFLPHQPIHETTPAAPSIDGKSLRDAEKEWKRKDFYKHSILTQSQRGLKAQAVALDTARGPGLYNLPPLKPDHPIRETTRSVRFTGDKRLDPIRQGHIYSGLEKRLVTIPGPGTYRPAESYKTCSPRDGRPWFEYSQSHEDKVREPGSGLPPGLHHTEHNTVQDFISRQVSTRGPYEIFSTDRWAKVNTGSPNLKSLKHYETADSTHLGPGTYNPCRTLHVKKTFKRMTENEKLMIKNRTSIPAHPPLIRINSNPGPGAYDIAHSAIKIEKADHRLRNKEKLKGGMTAKTLARGERFRENYGFLSGTKKRDKMATLLFKIDGGSQGAGPGRYNVDRFDELTEHQGHTSGHTNVFLSTTPQTAQYGSKHPQEQIKEIKRRTFKRVKAKLDYIDELAIAQQRRSIITSDNRAKYDKRYR